MNTPLGRPERDIYTVARLNAEARQLLESGLPPLWVEGEVSNFAAPSSGHWYFTLKDRDAQIRCAMFRGANSRLRFRPKDGLHVVVRGRVSLYEPRGDYQMIAEIMEDAVEGALQREFERLKARLATEGLFDVALKRPLPPMPKRIAIITSPTGAAVRDVLQILARRFPPATVLVMPTPVQGAAAAESLVAALDNASRRGEADVVILTRGGGSIEDLWCFNDERVARAIRRCAIPVITGIGHEIDFTIADFAADLRAPTPSGAAELVVPDRRTLLAALEATEHRMRRFMGQLLARAQERYGNLAQRLSRVHPEVRLRQQVQRLDELDARLRRATAQMLLRAAQRHDTLAQRLARVHPGNRLRQQGQRLDELEQRLRRGWVTGYVRSQQRLLLAQRGLDAISPLATLERGYAIVTNARGEVLQDAAEVRAGEEIEARLKRGVVRARVRDPLP
ncbi:MAG: exodeoxyribonuclease VII large subunit [Steroidobacteraceae bacterium]